MKCSNLSDQRCCFFYRPNLVIVDCIKTIVKMYDMILYYTMFLVCEKSASMKEIKKMFTRAHLLIVKIVMF